MCLPFLSRQQCRATDWSGLSVVSTKQLLHVLTHIVTVSRPKNQCGLAHASRSHLNTVSRAIKSRKHWGVYTDCKLSWGTLDTGHLSVERFGIHLAEIVSHHRKGLPILWCHVAVPELYPGYLTLDAWSFTYKLGPWKLGQNKYLQQLQWSLCLWRGWESGWQPSVWRSPCVRWGWAWVRRMQRRGWERSTQLGYWHPSVGGRMADR